MKSNFDSQKITMDNDMALAMAVVGCTHFFKDLIMNSITWIIICMSNPVKQKKKFYTLLYKILLA